MTSSGMKRGLATIAVSALAVTGLPALTGTASAQTLSSDAGGASQVKLYTQFNADNDASSKDDGTDSTVSLLAGGGSSIETVDYQYSLNGTDFVDIALSVARDSATGAFAYDWTVNPLLYGATVTLRVVGHTAAAPSVAADTADQAGVELRGPLAAQNSVEITTNEFRVFQQPYAGPNNKDLGIVEGTTSADAGSVTISARSGGASGTAAAPVTAGTPNTFAGVLDITGYTYGSFATATNNQIVIGADRDTDDAEAMQIVNQTLTTVTVTGTSDAPSGGTTTRTITVTDQNDEPVVGAQVYDTNGSRLIGYTDENGEVEDTAAAGGDHRYYANSTGNTAYESGIDPSDTDTIDTYIQTPASTSATSSDGTAFDDDEYAAGDIFVTVLDQQGNPVANRTVEYYWDVPGSAPNNRVPVGTAWSTATTDASGKATVVFPTSAPSGDNTLHFRVPADGNGQGEVTEDTMTVEAGQAALVLATTPSESGDPATAEGDAGSTVLVDGTLELESGTPLAGRVIDLSYTRGTEKSPGNGTADAGIVDGASIVLAKSVKTAVGGEIPTQTVKDQVETPQGSELGGVLAAETGNTVASGSSTLDGDAGASDSARIDFNSAESVGTVTLTGVLYNDEEELPTPGRPMKYTVNVESDKGTDLANQDVTIDFNTGQLFANNGTDPLPESAGATYGDFKAATDQTKVTTDGSGNAVFFYGLERNPGFDDNGEVDTTVTVTANGVSDDDEQTFTSGNEDYYYYTGGDTNYYYVQPLNAGAINLDLAAEEWQDSTALPFARTDDQNVAYDVTATDQFGNLVRVDYDGSDNTNQAHWSEDSGYTQFTSDDPDLYAYGNDDTDQVITVDWRNASTSSAMGVHTDVTRTDTASAAIQWYSIDFNESTFTLNHDTADTVAVGTAVTETVTALDQHAQPIDGLDVMFIRSGPNPQSGDANRQDSTDNDGEATYTFVGDTAGVAKISAVVEDYSGSDVAKLYDSVTFANSTGRQAIQAGLKLGNQADGDDVARVNAPSVAAGATVKLFKVKRDGTRVLLASKRANANGNAKFVRNDMNGNRFTSYKAKVVRTSDTFADWTPTKRIR